jgi:hypothetical protein
VASTPADDFYADFGRELEAMYAEAAHTLPPGAGLALAHGMLRDLPIPQATREVLLRVLTEARASHKGSILGPEFSAEVQRRLAALHADRLTDPSDHSGLTTA